MPGRFADKVALITGGGSGLGRLCALDWATEGAKVVVTDLIETRAIDVAKAITEAGGTAIGLKVDVTNELEVEQGVAVAVSTYGRLDIMLANAGKAPAGFGTIPFEDFTEAQWDDVNDVVYKGVFFCGKHAARAMKATGGGAIVVTTSASALNAYKGFGAYGAGKAGAVGLVKAMAWDFGKYGIRVNALAPTHGMSVNFAMPNDAGVLGLSYEEAALAERGGEWNAFRDFPGPLKVNRPPSLKDNAAVATFLASDDAMYISGTCVISCDGGSFARTSIPIPDEWSLEDEA